MKDLRDPVARFRGEPARQTRASTGSCAKIKVRTPTRFGALIQRELVKWQAVAQTTEPKAG